MTPTNPNSQGESNGKSAGDSLAGELEQECEKLRQLADKLKAREEALSEMEANYPAFRAFVYAKLRQYFEKELGELPDKDLETMIRDEEGEPLDAFIDELERMVERQ